MKSFDFTVSSPDGGMRLDMFLLQSLDGVSRSRIKSVIEDGGASVNGRSAKAGYAVKEGDRVVFDLPDPIMLEAKPENIALDIIYEDGGLAVVNKPQGMVVHPACGSESGTLVNALLYNLKSLSSINGVIRPGIVHRLDKDTSGLLVIAKTDAAHKRLSAEIQKKEAKRFYIALLDGNLKSDDGIIIAPVGRSRSDRKKMAVAEGGRYAETHYKTLERFGKYTLVEFELKTGRTHQIRVHAKHIGHPVVGDAAYGGSNAFKLKGQLLHAYKLIISSEKGESMIFEAPLPEYFLLVLDKLRK